MEYQLIFDSRLLRLPHRADGGGRVTGLQITISDMVFDARLETEKAPLTCAAFAERLPFDDRQVAAELLGLPS